MMLGRSTEELHRSLRIQAVETVDNIDLTQALS